jgi:hypothetical protein
VGFLVLAWSAAVVAAPERTWTDYEGTKVKARFLTITDGLVRLRQDRKPIAIPFHQLCRADREFIRAELIDRGEAHLVPTIGEPRQWTHKQETFEAQFVGPQENDIILLRNERPVIMPFSDFSQEDQEYIRKALVSKGQGHLVPQASQSSADGGGGAGGGVFGPADGYGSGSYSGRAPSYSGSAPPGTYGSTGGASSTYSGSVPTYQPRGSSGPTPSYSSGNSGSYGGSGGSSPTSPYGSSTVPGYNPSGSASSQLPSWSGADSSPPDIRSRIPDLRSSMPAFEPPSIPQIEYYKYCQRCGKRYAMSAEYCTACSGGGRWGRYGVLGAIIGAVAGIIGAVIKAIRS